MDLSGIEPEHIDHLVTEDCLPDRRVRQYREEDVPAREFESTCRGLGASVQYYPSERWFRVIWNKPGAWPAWLDQFPSEDMLR